MKKNIIALSGTHGTGKTTMVYKIATELKLAGVNCHIIQELARDCPFQINIDCSPNTQYWLLGNQLRIELEKSERYDIVITDRPLFDSIAYGIVTGIFKGTDNFDFFINYGLKKYKKIYLLDPVAFNYQIDDGIRDQDIEFRNNVHETLHKFYVDNNIDFHYTTYESDVI